MPSSAALSAISRVFRFADPLGRPTPGGFPRPAITGSASFDQAIAVYAGSDQCSQDLGDGRVLALELPQSDRVDLVLQRQYGKRGILLGAEQAGVTSTEDNLLRQVVYEGLREDKPAAEVSRPMPYPNPPRRRLARQKWHGEK
jgi:hypothetical protein